MNKIMTAVTALVSLAVVGCHHDKPHEYGQQRPPVDELDKRDKGLQSKDADLHIGFHCNWMVQHG